MAEDFLEEIYRNSYVIFEMEKVVGRARRRLEVADELNDFSLKFSESIKEILDHDMEIGKRLWEKWKIVLQMGDDLIRLADILEMDILPDVYLWMERFTGIDIEDEDGDCLYSSKSGFLSMKYRNFTLHSSGNPMLEAYNLIEEIYNPEKRDYYIYGSGLGYHVYQIYQRLAGYGRIVLFEPDPKMLQYAENYGVLSWIPADVIEIRQFASVKDFCEEAERCDAGVLLHIPSVQAIREDKERNLALGKWMQQNTYRRMDSRGKINSIRNYSLKLPDVGKLLKSLQQKEVVVVGAGPSVNQYWDQLRSWKGKKTIIAVGTIYKKLLQEKIYPDMVVIIDLDPRAYHQTMGVNKADVPLVIGPITYWEVAKNYPDSVYMIYKEIQDTSRHDPRTYWTAGGTVSYTAMELALYANPEIIYLIGLDLGFPQNERYAQGVEKQNAADGFGMVWVKSVNGGRIKTDMQMAGYIECIEALIARTPDVKFYNLSKEGALIRGALAWDTKRES